MTIREYLQAGLVLVPIPLGSKGPTKKGWNALSACVSDPKDAGRLTSNVGLAHAWSRTAAIDIDDLEAATRWLDARGVSLGALMDEPEAVRISSGRPNRAKLIYRLPDGVAPLASKKIIEAKQNIIDFRCATAQGTTVQDVLPPSVHPETGKPYVWEYADDTIGDWRALPTLPGSILKIWQDLLTVTAPAATAAPTADLPELRELLKNHDPSCDRDAWVKVLAILHYETGGSAEGLALADEWSAGSPKYAGTQDVETRWSSFKLDRAAPATAASLRVDKAADPDDFDVIEAPAAAVVAPIPGFARDDKGKIKSTIGNLLIALRAASFSGYQIRKDTFRDEIMLSQGATWRPFQDADYVALREGLERRGFKPIGRDSMRDAVLKVATENQFDSAITWLNAQRWDGVPRVDGFLERYFAVAPSPYAVAVSRYLLTALAGRVLEPGCKADMVPVFLGPQGCGKTRGVEALAPEPDHETKIDLSERDDDLARTMRGRLIGEIAELKGLQQREAGSIKAFLSRSRDTWIPKYIEFATSYARRIVFIGTTNEEEFLADETGNRRWLPIKVGVVDVLQIRNDCSQLWAEAACIFAAEGIAYQAAERLSSDEHGQYVVTDSWEDAIETWLDGTDDLGDGGKQRRERPITVSELAIGALQMDIKTCGRSQELRIGKILRRFGFDKRSQRVAGVVRKVWLLPLLPFVALL